MDPVVENVLVELRVELPADADIPVVANAPERTWLWSDLHLSDPSVPGRPTGTSTCPSSTPTTPPVGLTYVIELACRPPEPSVALRLDLP